MQNNYRKKLKLLAFKNTSAELLVKEMPFPVIYLPSNKIKDSEILKNEIIDTEMIICFGQKPLIKNKLCLELLAKNQKESIKTNFEIESFEKLLELNNIHFSESSNPGTSFCNLVYWNGLNFIKEQKLSCKLLFIHIPFEKNIDCISDFREKNCKVLNSL